MRKITFILVLFVSFMHVVAQTPDRTILIDFGPATQTTLSQLTPNPDVNNNYWNNFTNNTASSAALTLVDKANNATGISIKTLVDFQVNPTPGAPGISDPAQLNATALGNMAIPTATVDYFFTQTTVPSLKFTGLSSSKSYKFYVYGARLSSSDVRISQYTFTGTNSAVGTLKTSEANLGGAGVHANNSNIYTTPFLICDANAEIKLELVAHTGGFGYINAIRIEEYSGSSTIKVTDIEVSGENSISVNGGAVQLSANVLPSNATVKDYVWSVSDPKIATITPDGRLKALKNGTVTVYATTIESGSTVAGSKQIAITGQDVALREIFIDFGPGDGTNGDLTPVNVADANGNFWNNVSANAPNGITPLPSAQVNLVDKSKTATGINVSVTTGTIKTNGKLNGALLSPNISFLGELGITTATCDYFFVQDGNGTLTFSGLNVGKGYRFRIFGSRDNTETRVSRYTFTGSNVVTGLHQTSGLNIGGAGVNRNVADIYISDLVFPGANGMITLNLANQQSGFGYINALKIDEYEIPFVPVTSITVSGNDIDAVSATSQMTAIINPSDATVKDVVWSVDNTALATINPTGLLFPRNNGTVTVTATSKQTGAAVSGSKQIQISNQIDALYVSGTATEHGDNLQDAVQMKRLTDANGNLTGIFELFTTLNETGILRFFSDQSNDAVTYGLGTNGQLVVNGAAIDPVVSGQVLITVDMSLRTLSIVAINSVDLIGAAGSAQLTYSGLGTWSGSVSLANVITDADKGFSFRMNGENTSLVKRVSGTVNILMKESTAISLGIPVEKIPTDKNSYRISIDLNKFTYSVACPNTDNFKIAYMGSSVAYGTGAYLNRGYNYLYTKLLTDRYTQSKGLNFTTVNISIGGNNTLNLLSRINNDLFPLCAKYVIFGLSLGNEGIHNSTDQEAVFNQFRNNMQKLIAMAREKGMTPVMTNNYTRNDFNASDYSYIKRINMLIHEWDLPTINLLGAIDDGSGRWASGYWADDFHPNDAGHAEFSYSMVPSMFDALDAGKPLPVRAKNNSITFTNGVTVNQLQYTPDNTLHSFTHSFDFKTSQAGILSTIKSTGALKIDSETGAIVYTSPQTSAKITGTAAVNDNKWHRVTLTHYYARGLTAVYIDSTLIGQVYERLVCDNFKLNHVQGPSEVSFRDWFFYRAGMNREEIAAICAGRMLKSGLELYAPLYAQGENQLANLAQSTTTITKVQVETSVKPAKQNAVNLFPNPAANKVKLAGLKNDRTYECRIYLVDGRHVFTANIHGNQEIDISTLAAGQYILEVLDQMNLEKELLKFAKL